MTLPTLPDHEPHHKFMKAYTEAQMLQFQRDTVKSCARVFDDRDKGPGGFYEPTEPAEIIRSLLK